MERIALPYDTFTRDKHAVLAKQKMLDILSGPAPDKVSHAAAWMPKGGEVYVFQISSLPHCEDIKCDGYTWRQTSNLGYPEDNPVLMRRYYTCFMEKKKCPGFKRVIANLTDSSSDYCLVQYLGDHTLFQGHPHGNAKNDNRRFIPESKAVKAQILQVGEKNPKNVYNDMQNEACKVGKSVIHIPRNPKKVSNVIDRSRQEKRLTHDALYNVFALAKSIPNFVSQIRIHPEVNLHLIHTPLLESVREALSFATKENPACFGYDTTFELGDFFVSVLCFRNPVFNGAPVIPIAFHIHERKSRRDHDLFIQNFFSVLLSPTAMKAKVAFVTDREFAFEHFLPDWVVQVYCWNHLRRNARDFVRYRAQGTRVEADALSLVAYKLLKCESEEKYMLTRDVESRLWGAVYCDYFDKSLDDAVKKSGRWVLEDLGIYSPTSGVTSNCSESTNSMIKRLSLWKERPLDVFSLGLYELCRFYENEIQRGLHGTGSFVLLKGLTPLPISDLPRLLPTVHPSEIVDTLKQSNSAPQVPGQMTEDLPVPNHLKPDCYPNESASISSMAPSTSPEQVEKPLGDPFNEIDPPSTPKRSIAAFQAAHEDTDSSSSKIMAQRVIDERRISLVPEQRSFLVEGSDKRKYAVTLHPEQCTCPATGMCYHIEAALMSIGADTIPKKRRVVNLTVLGKRSRPKSSGKSGRKKPRKVDEVDIRAAPDSKEEGDGVQVKCVNPPISAKNEDSLKVPRVESTICASRGVPTATIIRVDADNSFAESVGEKCALEAYVPSVEEAGSSGIPYVTASIAPAEAAPVQLMQWGTSDGSVDNTCPIDNLLGIAFVSYKLSPAMAESLRRGMTNGEKTLHLAMKLMDADQHQAAKKVWTDFVTQIENVKEKLKIVDLYGGECDYFLNYFRSVFEIKGEDRCGKQDMCPRPEKVYKYNLLSVSPGNSIQDQIVGASMPHSIPCTESLPLEEETAKRYNTRSETAVDDEVAIVKRTPECDGERYIYDMAFTRSNAWLYPLDLAFNDWTVQHALDSLPKTIDVLQKQFHLRGVTVRLRGVVERANHFVSYIWMSNQWNYYDGILNGGRTTFDLPAEKPGKPNVAFYTL